MLSGLSKENALSKEKKIENVTQNFEKLNKALMGVLKKNYDYKDGRPTPPSPPTPPTLEDRQKKIEEFKKQMGGSASASIIKKYTK